MVTSDERREVAARLRGRAIGVAAAYPSVHALNDFWVYRTLHEIAEAIGCAEDPHPAEWMARLADLIDPTCRDFGGEEGTNGEGYDFACSACGYVCDLAEPKFCPNCGARVVSGDAQ